MEAGETHFEPMETIRHDTPMEDAQAGSTQGPFPFRTYVRRARGGRGGRGGCRADQQDPTDLSQVIQAGPPQQEGRPHRTIKIPGVGHISIFIFIFMMYISFFDDV